MPAHALAAGIREGDFRAADVTDSFLNRIAAVDGSIGAYIEVFETQARREAETVDANRAAGQTLGPLAGVPVAIKDIYNRRGFEVGCGSRILEGYKAPYTATAVARMEAAGAVILGRTNMDEFAMGSSTEHSCHGPTRNPFDLERAPGGSSGGSAAAVAARLAPLALGSDTGGSVRQPASLCGVPGIKPTYGRISRYGMIAYASSLDHVAPFGRTVEDLALALTVLSGEDPRDSTSLADPVPDYCQPSSRSMEGLRVGIPEEYFGEGLNSEVETSVRTAIEKIQAMGATISPLSLPHTEYAIPAYYLIATSEASSNLARYDGVRFGMRHTDAPDLESMYSNSRQAGFGAEVKLRILLGAFCLCSGYYDAWYLKATKVRTLIRRDFEEAFCNCDVIMAPTSPIPAFRLKEKLDDPLAMYLCDVLTAPANLAGIPAISIPCGATSEGLPIGLQILGPALGEQEILRVAAAYQNATEHHQMEPIL